MIGLVVGSYQGCSEALHGLAREAAEARARSEWRRMGAARSEHERGAGGLHACTDDVHRRWGSVLCLAVVAHGCTSFYAKVAA